MLGGGKIGHITELISYVSYSNREIDERLVRRYPLTEQGDSEFVSVIIFHIVTNLVGILLLTLAIIILQKNVKWARRVNPVIVTAAFILESPM